MLRGQALLADPRLNKQSAFTDSEREELGLVGLLPQRVETIDQQLARVRRQLSEHHGMLAKNVYLRELHDRNETLFYRLLIDDLPELRGTLHAAPILSPVAHGRLRGVDLSAVQSAPGVRAVVLAQDIPGDPLLATFAHDEPILAQDTVQHVGQVIGLVVADSAILRKVLFIRTAQRSRTPMISDDQLRSKSV